MTSPFLSLTFFPGVIPGVSLSIAKAVKASPVFAFGSERANRKYLGKGGRGKERERGRGKGGREGEGKREREGEGKREGGKRGRERDNDSKVSCRGSYQLA